LTGLPSAASRTQASFAQRLGRADAGAHAAEDVLVEDRLRRAASGVPVAIWRMNSGMSMEVGQAVMQGASWQK
jgi:hypothetical protein